MKNKLSKTALITLLVWTMISSCSKKPEACITAPSWVEVNQNFNYSSCSVSTDTYSWDLGDGMTGISSSGEYQYPYLGNYTITLTAYNKKKKDITTHQIAVYGPAHKFQNTYNVTTVCSIGIGAYQMYVTKTSESTIELSNFIGGATVQANVTGTTFDIIPKSGITDQNAHLWNLTSGTGTYNNGYVTIQYTLTDVPYSNQYGVKNCNSTCQVI